MLVAEPVSTNLHVYNPAALMAHAGLKVQVIPDTDLLHTLKRSGI